jgi:hypothetical protein
MLRSLPVRYPLFVLSILLLGSFFAVAQGCPDLLEADCGGGTAWFGLRHDGANIGQGQTVTLDCETAVLSVEFLFQVTGMPNGEVPSMIAGDEIHVVLMDADGNHLASATTAVPADVFTDWLEFSFPEDFVVPAGQYQLAAYTTVERQCAFAFCVGDGADDYDGGQRIVSLNGIDGPWFDFGTGHDVPFRLHLDSGSVANEVNAWGSVKGLYR